MRHVYCVVPGWLVLCTEISLCCLPLPTWLCQWLFIFTKTKGGITSTWPRDRGNFLHPFPKCSIVSQQAFFFFFFYLSPPQLSISSSSFLCGRLVCKEISLVPCPTGARTTVCNGLAPMFSGVGARADCVNAFCWSLVIWTQIHFNRCSLLTPKPLQDSEMLHYCFE